MQKYISNLKNIYTNTFEKKQGMWFKEKDSEEIVRESYNKYSLYYPCYNDYPYEWIEEVFCEYKSFKKINKDVVGLFINNSNPIYLKNRDLISTNDYFNTSFFF